jgi:PcfJ-like protein
MPHPLPSMRFWLRAVRYASWISTDFAEFIAKHATEVGATVDEASTWIEDTADWVRACLPASDQTPRLAAEFVTRQFSRGMSVKTVTALTHEWHEAVANNMTGPSYEFPEPWAQAGTTGNYEIVPITNNADLYREGNAMHHCVGTYGESVREGRCYIYSLRKDGARVATIELFQFDGRVDLGQIRGPCNSSVPREIALAVQKWFKSQKTFQLPKKPIRQEIFVPPENPAPRPIIVPPENPAARPIIALPENRVPEQIIGLPEQQTRSPTPIVCPLATAEPDADEVYDPDLCLDDPDLCFDDPDLFPDDPDFVVGDDIDGTMDADFAEFYHIGDEKYDEDEDDEFVR